MSSFSSCLVDFAYLHPYAKAQIKTGPPWHRSRRRSRHPTLFPFLFFGAFFFLRRGLPEENPVLLVFNFSVEFLEMPRTSKDGTDIFIKNSSPRIEPHLLHSLTCLCRFSSLLPCTQSPDIVTFTLKAALVSHLLPYLYPKTYSLLPHWQTLRHSYV